MTTAGCLGAASTADAALFYWQDNDPSYYRPAPRTSQPHKHRSHRRSPAKTKAADHDTGAKPQGPLIINVSISQQKVRIFDANGLFAESPVSTGMKGHSTPMGVFSVIQKHKYHRSNIYSGAPMPYMQRITWSGVAMHAGVLPGYPASHGCIRMPMAFAIKMWNWTKMGARVIVTPGEITPVNFSHPLLVAQKVVPQPVIADDPKVDAPLGVKGDKGADAGLELRSTVGHVPSQQTRTADASGTMTADAGITMSDATPAVAGQQPAIPDVSQPAQKSDSTTSGTDAAPAKAAEPTATDSKPAVAATEIAKPAETAPVAQETETPASSTADTAKADASPTGSAKAEEKPAEANTEAKSGDEKTEPAKADVAKTEPVTTEPVTTEPATGPAKADAAPADAAKAAESATAESKPVDAKPGETEAKAVETKAVETTVAPKTAEPETATTKAVETRTTERATTAPKAVEKPAEPVNTVADAPAIAPDAKKDTARLPGAEKAAKAEPPKLTGRVAMFASRKDSKLYVRENFKPLFDIPVTIEASDRPLGTHVFTAEADKSDPNLLHWSVVSLPVSVRHAHNEDSGGRRHSRRHKTAHAAPAEVKPVPVADSPAEALNRITIPPEAMARVTAALTTGSSIVVSDQGINQGETGEGTDFIVSLH